MRKTALCLASALLIGGMASAPALAAIVPGTTLSMVATAYGPTAQDNYPYGAVDYFGQPLTQGDIAVDPSVIPLKTCVYVTGYASRYLPSGGEIGEADDEGGAIQGHRVDLYYKGTESQINRFGIQRVQVTILGKPTNPSASGTAACAGYEKTIRAGGAKGSGSQRGTVVKAHKPARSSSSSGPKTSSAISGKMAQASRAGRSGTGTDRGRGPSQGHPNAPAHERRFERHPQGTTRWTRRHWAHTHKEH